MFNFEQKRLFSNISETHSGALEVIYDKYLEAREYIEDARESIGTNYIDEDFEDAENMVNEVISDYLALTVTLDEDQKLQVHRKLGLRMEEIKAELEALRTLLNEE